MQSSQHEEITQKVQDPCEAFLSFCYKTVKGGPKDPIQDLAGYIHETALNRLESGLEQRLPYKNKDELQLLVAALVRLVQ